MLRLQLRSLSATLLAEVLCKIEWSYWITSTVPPVLLMTMAYERYKAIVHPLSTLNKAVIKARIKCMIIFAWISGLVYLAMDMAMVQYDNVNAICTLKSHPWFHYRAFFMFFLVTQHLIPTIAILVLYARVIYALRKQDNALGSQAQAERARRKARKNVMWTIIVVTVVFYICCGIPQTVYILYQVSSDVFIHSHISKDILVVSLACNSAFNPVAYFIFIKSFRDGFKRVFVPKMKNSNAISSSRRSQTLISLEPVSESRPKNSGSSQPALISFSSLIY